MNLELSIVLVALAGGIGSTLRHLASKPFSTATLGILLINGLGSFIAGAVYDQPGLGWVLIGLAGGMTTFSTFAGQTHALWSAGRRLPAVLNGLLNLVFPALMFLTGQILI